jgi:PKD repeat protein
LKPWFDPNNTGATTLAGIAAPCSSPTIPVAQFVANPTTLAVNGTSQLTDQSTGNPTAWTWSISPATGWTFINSTNASSQNPQLQFTSAGMYSVTLTASNLSGSSTPLTKTNYIQVTTATNPCVASSTGCDEFIQQVIVGTINNTSACNNYTSYNQSTTLVKGNNYSISITPQIQGQNPGTAYTGDEIAAWIDYNGNLSFADAGEQIAFVSIGTGNPLQWNFTVPTTAVTGTVKLRVRMVYNGTGGDGPITPCGTSTFGEVEDYNIVLTASASVLESNPLQGISLYPNPTHDGLTIDLSAVPQDNLQIELLDVTGKLVKTYGAEISNTIQLNLADLPAGYYQIRAFNGASEVIKKVVKL